MNTKRLRTIIPLAVIGVIGVGFATHVGVGTLSAIGWQDISLLCPLGALATMIATKTLLPRAVISVVIALALSSCCSPAPSAAGCAPCPWCRRSAASSRRRRRTPT